MWGLFVRIQIQMLTIIRSNNQRIIESKKIEVHTIISTNQITGLNVGDGAHLLCRLLFFPSFVTFVC